jgi:hypothetical protein
MVGQHGTTEIVTHFNGGSKAAMRELRVLRKEQCLGDPRALLRAGLGGLG